jgi:hypothetical protein
VRLAWLETGFSAAGAVWVQLWRQDIHNHVGRDRLDRYNLSDPLNPETKDF